MHNVSLKVLYHEFSNLSILLFFRYVLPLITIHAITWNARVSRSRRDANKVSISSTTVTSCFLTSGLLAITLKRSFVTKWIRGWPKWDAWVSAGTRKVDFRSLCHSFVRQRRDAFTTHLSGRSLVISVFLFLRDAAVSRCGVRLGLSHTWDCLRWPLTPFGAHVASSSLHSRK